MAVGCGFLCSQDFLLTCSHVVEQALNTNCVTSGSAVSVRFAELKEGEDREPVVFEVVEAFAWFDGPAGGSALEREREDICLLRLAAGQRIPDAARPARSDISEVEAGLTYTGIGLKMFRTGPDVVAINGSVRKETLFRWIVKSEDEDEATRKGSSGAAVFHKNKGLLGMISMAQGKRSGRIIPVDALRKVHPIAPVSTTESTALLLRTRSSSPTIRRTWEHASLKLDRKPQSVDFETLQKAQWENHQTGTLCLLGGLAEDLPVECVKRLCADYWQMTHRAAHQKQRPKPRHIDWPDFVRANRITQYTDRLRNLLANELHASGSSPEDMRAALERLNKPNIVYSMIDHQHLDGAQFELLREWCSYFGEINASPLSQNLIHFIILRFKQDEQILLNEGSSLQPLTTRTGIQYLGDKATAISEGQNWALHEIEFLDVIRTDQLTGWIELTGSELDRGEDDTEAMVDAANRHFGEAAEFRYIEARDWLRQYDAV